MIEVIIPAITAGLVMIIVACVIGCRRITEKAKIEYINKFPKYLLPLSESEQYIINNIEEIFYGGTQDGKISPEMKVMDLYETVAGKYSDDMELERLVDEIERRWNTKVPKTYDFRGMTIGDVAKYFDSRSKVAANQSVNSSP